MIQTSSSADIERFRCAIVRRLGLYFEDAKLGFLADILRRRLAAIGQTTDIHLARLETENLPDEVAKDDQEALDYLFAAGNHTGDPALLPEVVLLDLKLPKIDGLDVLRRMHADERTRRLPVVVLTSSMEEQDVLQSYDLGANSFVQKPVDFAEFIVRHRTSGCTGSCSTRRRRRRVERETHHETTASGLDCRRL